MKIIQRIGILLLLLVFLCGTTGISIFEHICSCKGKTEITLFPEIFAHQSSCCCSAGEVELVTPDHAHLCNLSKPEHCKNIKFFIKATVTPAPVVVSQFSFIDFTVSGFQLPSDFSIGHDATANDYVIPHCTSPPVSGKERVLALHQPKIPVPHFSFV
ncbi:MAG: hypothetical protein WCJ26_04555 [bacterium]